MPSSNCKVTAAAKGIGGVDFAYDVRGGGHESALPVPAPVPRAALKAILATLSPRELRVPARLLPLLSAGYPGNADPQFDLEVFPNAGGPVFDPLAAADASAALTLGVLLAPQRLNRVFLQHAQDPGALSVTELLDNLFAATLATRPDDLERRIAYRTALALAASSRDARTSPGVAALLEDRLHTLAGTLTASTDPGPDGAWSRHLGRLLLKPAGPAEVLPAIPPGEPIGSTALGAWADLY